jgi:hypothetical protein
LSINSKKLHFFIKKTDKKLMSKKSIQTLLLLFFLSSTAIAGELKSHSIDISDEDEESIYSHSSSQKSFSEKRATKEPQGIKTQKAVEDLDREKLKALHVTECEYFETIKKTDFPSTAITPVKSVNTFYECRYDLFYRKIFQSVDTWSIEEKELKKIKAEVKEKEKALKLRLKDLKQERKEPNQKIEEKYERMKAVFQNPHRTPLTEQEQKEIAQIYTSQEGVAELLYNKSILQEGIYFHSLQERTERALFWSMVGIASPSILINPAPAIFKMALFPLMVGDIGTQFNREVTQTKQWIDLKKSIQEKYSEHIKRYPENFEEENLSLNDEVKKIIKKEKEHMQKLNNVLTEIADLEIEKIETAHKKLTLKNKKTLDLITEKIKNKETQIAKAEAQIEELEKNPPSAPEKRRFQLFSQKKPKTKKHLEKEIGKINTEVEKLSTKYSNIVDKKSDEFKKKAVEIQAQSEKAKLDALNTIKPKTAFSTMGQNYLQKKINDVKEVLLRFKSYLLGVKRHCP